MRLTKWADMIDRQQKASDAFFSAWKLLTHMLDISPTQLCFTLLQPNAKQRTQTHKCCTPNCAHIHTISTASPTCYHICTSAAKPNLDCAFLLHPQCSPGRPLVVGHVRHFWHITEGIFIKNGRCLSYLCDKTNFDSWLP